MELPQQMTETLFLETSCLIISSKDAKIPQEQAEYWQDETAVKCQTSSCFFVQTQVFSF